MDEFAAVAALGEPTRRRLYHHVARQPASVCRDEVAAATGVPRATVAFHLDRLVGEGLLEVSYERPAGRAGPGAGRPAKRYRRAERQVTVSLPERRYELAGHLLAGALDEADRSGRPPRQVLARHAHEFGRRLGTGGHEVMVALEEQGFEPRVEGGDVLLSNCPFHHLARTHGDLVCGMTLSLLDGLLAGLGDTSMRTRPDPAPGRCCVRLVTSGIGSNNY